MGSVPSRFSAKKTNLFHSASRISFGWIPLQHMSRGDGTDRVARRDGCPFEPGSTCGIPSHASASRIDGRAYVRFHASRLHRRRDGMAHPPYSMFQRPFRRILPFLAWSPRCISIVLRVMWMVSSPSNGPFFAISHRGNAPPLPPFPVRTLRRTPYDAVPLFDLLSPSRIPCRFATFPLRACLRCAVDRTWDECGGVMRAGPPRHATTLQVLLLAHTRPRARAARAGGRPSFPSTG